MDFYNKHLESPYHNTIAGMFLDPNLQSVISAYGSIAQKAKYALISRQFSHQASFNAYPYIISLGNEDIERAILYFCFENKPNNLRHALKNPYWQSADTKCDFINLALLFRHTEIVLLLLRDGRCDPSGSNNYPLRRACQAGCLTMIPFLLADKRVNPTAQKNEAIGMAAWNNYPEIVKLLLADSRVNPEDANQNAIRLAATSNCIETVKLLLTDLRIALTYVVDTHYPPQKDIIYEVLENGHLEMVELLLADSRAKPSEECFNICIKKNYGEIFKLLWKHPENNYVKQNLAWRYMYEILDSATPLMEIFEYLLENEEEMYCGDSIVKNLIKLLLKKQYFTYLKSIVEKSGENQRNTIIVCFLDNQSLIKQNNDMKMIEEILKKLITDAMRDHGIYPINFNWVETLRVCAVFGFADLVKLVLSLRDSNLGNINKCHRHNLINNASEYEKMDCVRLFLAEPSINGELFDEKYGAMVLRFLVEATPEKK